MILIMIRIKEVVPEIVQETLKSQASILNDPTVSPKEVELLLRLFLSSLSSDEVLKEIHNASGASGALIINNFQHLSVDTLIHDYIQIENGILDVQDISVLKRVVKLMNKVIAESSPFNQSVIIEQMLNRSFKKNTEQSRILLTGVSTILKWVLILLVTNRNISYILTAREIDQLIELYSDITFR